MKKLILIITTVLLFALLLVSCEILTNSDKTDTIPETDPTNIKTLMLSYTNVVALLGVT